MQITGRRGYWYIGLSILLLLSLLASQTKIAQAHYDQAANRALAVFVTARAINAVVSVIQDTDIDITPAGVGVSTSPGELLDPLNDMVERLSWIMLGASLALKTQGYVMEIMDGQIATFSLIFLFMVSILSVRSGFRYLPPLFLKIFIVISLIQLMMPSTFLLHHWMHSQLFAKSYETAHKSLQGAQTKLEQYEQNQEVKTTSAAIPSIKSQWWERPFDWLDRQYRDFEESYRSWSLREKFTNLQQDINDWINQMLELATQFIMTTLLLPFFMLWLVYRSSLAILQYDFRTPSV